MVNWFQKQLRKREARVQKGEPLSPAERDLYKKTWAKAGRVVGLLVERATGRRQVSTITEKTAEKYGEHVAKRIDRAIAERNRGDPPNV